MRSPGTPLLAVSGITKRYGDVIANDGVSLAVDRGEVLGVLGENGAGKSTLMRMLAGLVAPDSGEIRLDGQVVALDSPRAAAATGIGMVHQHFMLVGALTVAENLALGDRRWGRHLVDYRALRARIATLARELDMTIDFDAKIDALPIGRQQQVEILKTLARDPALVILDEPTAVLPPEERDALYRMIARLKAGGRAVILISHKLEDIEACCDRIVVMRQGRVVGESAMAGVRRSELVRLVVGDELVPIERTATSGDGERALVVEGLTVKRVNGTLALDDVSFELRAGRILGVCGVEGNGQTELVHALAGMLAGRGRTVYRFHGREHIGPIAAHRLRALGLAHIAEDRLRHAVVASLPLAENWLLTRLHDRRLNRRGVLAPRTAAAQVRRAVDAYEIKTSGPNARVRELSGGNQQKLVLARELAANPAIVLAAHPSRGLDVRTTAAVKRELLAARARGAAILLVSSDLNETWEMADDVMVMVDGRVRGPVAITATTIQEVGHWMTSR